MSELINKIKLTVTTTGSDGSATGSAVTAANGGLTGFLHSIHVKPLVAGWAATTDITITETGGAGRTLLTLANKSSAAATYPVRVQEVGADGTGTSTYTMYALNGEQITVSMAQANVDTDALEVWLYLVL